MELELTRESICINEVVFDSVLDLPIEFDYLLPDYCQSIFKVLKCKILPKITSRRIANGKLIIDGVALIKVIYTSEECYKIRSITQKQVFTKSVDLKENYQNAIITSYAKCDYVNCRVVNQHRLDIRGGVSIKTTISVSKKIDVLCKATGNGVQYYNQKIMTLGERLSAQKEFDIREDFELSYGKPPIIELLDYDANAIITEQKIIQNKIILKGEIMLHILYSQVEDDKPEIMDYSVPISQIVDIVGVNEDYQCIVALDVVGVEISLKNLGDAEIKGFEAKFIIRADVEADINDETELISDIYSTDYDIKSESDQIKLEHLVCIINECCIAKSEVEIPQNEIACIYDIMCEFQNATAKFCEDAIEITGYLNTSVLALDCDNMPIMIDRSSACTMKIDCKCPSETMRFSPHITVSSVSYNMVNAECIEIRAEIKVCGNLYDYKYHSAVNSITIDENCKKAKDDSVAMRLYFAQKGEIVWDIAKQFNTSVNSIMLENNIEKEEICEAGMLLITD